MKDQSSVRLCAAHTRSLPITQPFTQVTTAVEEPSNVETATSASASSTADKNADMYTCSHHNHRHKTLPVCNRYMHIIQQLYCFLPDGTHPLLAPGRALASQRARKRHLCHLVEKQK